MVQYALKSTPKKIYSTHEKTGKRSKKSSPATKGQKSLTMFFKKKTHTHNKIKHEKSDFPLFSNICLGTSFHAKIYHNSVYNIS